MSSDPFVHLHVASGYSLRHGASTPLALVEQAVAHGMSALALTDRDGLYGAAKFALAAEQAGLAPILGVDLATAPTGLVDGLPAWADPAQAARSATARRGPARRFRRGRCAGTRRWTAAWTVRHKPVRHAAAAVRGTAPRAGGDGIFP